MEDILTRETRYGRLIWEGFQRAGAINHVPGPQQTKVTDTDLELTQEAARTVMISRVM